MKKTADRLSGLFQPALDSGLGELATPAAIVDLPLLRSNIERGIRLYRAPGVNVRPHLKTAKCLNVARMLLTAGAGGVCVAKVGEAEVMAEGGIEDILITSPIGHAVTAAWFARLVREHQAVKIVVDSVVGAAVVSEALRKNSVEQVNVLIDVNVGQNRTGVQPGAAALTLAEQIAHSFQNLRIIGVQGYEGHLQHIHDSEERRRGVEFAMAQLVDTAASLRRAGHCMNVVSTGGTGTSRFSNSIEGVTEVQPGSFIYMDVDYRAALGEGDFEHAFWVLSTVISKPFADKATIDAGWKTLSVDCGFAHPVDKRFSYTPAGDEHGYITGEGVAELQVGNRVALIPGHIDTTVNMHDIHYVVENGKVVDVWTVHSRGRVQ